MQLTCFNADCEDFVKHPVLRGFVSKMSGWDDNTLGLRRTLLRNNTPGNHAIGVHYDQIFLRYGQPNSFTAWVPIGDVDIQGGGLIYLENSEISIRSGNSELALIRHRRQPGPGD